MEGVIFVVFLIGFILLIGHWLGIIYNGGRNNVLEKGWQPKELRPAGWTPKANQYKIYWQDELDAKINQRVKEIAEHDKLTEIDDRTMKRAILDVVNIELINLSNRR